MFGKKTLVIGGVAMVALVLILSACSTKSGGTSGSITTPRSSSSHAASPSAPAPSNSPQTGQPSANDQRLIYWLANVSTDTSGVGRAVAGGTMRAYVSFEATIAAALAANGTPEQQATVITIPSGYQISHPNGSGGTQTDTFTAFQHDAAGRVTGMDVNGQPVAGRIAAGTNKTGRLQVTGAVAYKPAAFGELEIAFNVKNTGGALTNGTFLVYFTPSGGSQLAEDRTNSITPPSLQPGESVALVAVFGTTTPTGTLALRDNTQLEPVLASTTLTRP